MAAPILADYFNARKGLLPLDTADPDLLLDADFTLGETSIDALLVGTNGMTKVPGGVWDKDGFNPNLAGGYYSYNWIPPTLASRAGIGNAFTVHLEVERKAVSSSWIDSQPYFIDSLNGPSLSTPYSPAIVPVSIGMVFKGEGAGNFLELYLLTNSGPVSNLEFKLASSVSETIGGVINPQPMVWQDAFLKVDMVIDNGRVRYYLDNLLTWETALSIATIPELLQSIGIGIRAGATQPFRGKIRRVQIIKRAVDNRLFEAPRICFFGDSYIFHGSGMLDPATDSQAAIDAVQNADIVSRWTHVVEDPYLNPVNAHIWDPLTFALRRFAARNALPFTSYTSGHGGYNWGNTQLHPFTTVQLMAAAKYNPQIVVALGSINDIVPSAPPLSLLADTKAKLDTIIDNSPNLKVLLFFETIDATIADQAAGLNSSAWYALYLLEIAELSALDGYRGVVKYVPAKSSLPVSDSRFFENTHPAGAFWEAQFGKTVNDTGGMHPSQWGWNRVAEWMWESLQQFLTQMPTV